MTTKDTTEEPPEQAAEPTKDSGKKEETRTGLPLGHVLLGGASATTLGGFYLASAVGPWAVAGVGAGAVAAGGAYVHHRMAKKRGRTGEATRTVKTQKTSRSGGGALGRMGLGGARRGATSGSAGSSGSASGSKRRGSSAALGSVGTGRKGGTSGAAGAARPAGGRGSGSSSRPSAGRGSTGTRPLGGGRGSSGGSGRGLLGRRAGGSGRGASGGSGTAGGAARKGMGRPHSTPPGDGGLPPSSGEKKSRFRMGRGSKASGGGSASTGSRSRWGGASGTTGSARPGRLRAAARRAAGWADGRTGTRASTAYKAATGARGLRGRARAARQALRSKANHNRVWTPTFAAFGALAAGLTSWGGRIRAAQHARAHRAMDAVDPDAHTTHAAHSTGHDTPTADTAESEDIAAPTAPTTTASATAGPTGRTTTMAGLPHARAANDMLSAGGRYEPADAYTVIREAREWPDVSRDVALSIRAYAQRLETARFPLDSACLDKIQEYYTAVSKTIAIAEEIEPLLRKAHQVDLERQESPRGDESKWNV